MRKILFGIVLAFSVAVANAQSVREIFDMSKVDYSSSTARSSAMGGAFGSLGADAASMSINPAGVGMYKSSEVTISPSIVISSVNSTSLNRYNGNSLSSKENKGALTVNNGSFVYNIFNDSRHAVTSLTIGFGYNQRYNNTSNSYSLGGKSSISIADYFASQLYGLNNNAITSTDGNYYGPYESTSPNIWGAVMAWNSGLLFSDPDQFGNQAYYTTGYDESGNEIGSLFYGDHVYPSLSTKNRGYSGEYNFSLGGSVRDIFYFGVTMGVSNFEYRKSNYYRETTPNDNVGDLAELRYYQDVHTSGLAFNFKAGITAQPVKGLRLGVSVHAPNIFSVDDEYSSYMKNFYYVGSGIDMYDAESALYVNKYRTQTPTRFISGISYTFANIAILSFDYERVWYNKMKVKDIDYAPGEVTFDHEISQTYKPVNNFRAGLEINAGIFAIRGGYAHYSNADRYVSDDFGKIRNISAGIGFKHRVGYVDLTYVNSRQNLPAYKYYSANYGAETVESQSTIYPKQTNNNIIMTIGFKF